RLRRGTARRPRRQWGADRRTHGLPAVPKPATNASLGAARVAILVTVVGGFAFLLVTLGHAFGRADFSVRTAIDATVYVAVVTLLTGSALAYLVARLGFLYRTREHHRIPRAVIDSFFDDAHPTVTVLVPSYREEPAVIRQTLLSAALQEYPGLRIVLLVDDPPNPSEEHNRELLEAARRLPHEVAELLREPAHRFARAARAAAAASTADADASPQELAALADHYDDAARLARRLGRTLDTTDHSAAFVETEVLQRLAGEFVTIATALREAATENASLEHARLLQLYRRLAWTFSAEITSFERKHYMSLSHEPNKAMNLNSYIGLMGGRYVEAQTARGPLLLEAGDEADVEIADSDYVLTLDADSVLLPEYCLRLVHLLEQPEFEHVAVAQTPYSAFPGAATRLERIAGATTDIQHIVHQGLTHYGSTFWVGANAVLRKRALDAIETCERVGGRVIRRYVQDRTPIEDTESTVDLVLEGWSLYNYPERLAYSATPPDFGSLIVQRQRW